MTWAKTAVFLSALAAAFVCAQWWEIHEGGKDTHELAVAAGNQANWTQRLADSAGTQADRTKDLVDRMKDQTDRTKDLADQATIQAKEARVAADAAKSAAETASNQLKLTERPWLTIKNRIISPLTFNVGGRASGIPVAMMTVEDTIENVGTSVAVACSLGRM